MTHPEPPDEVETLTDEQIDQVAYVLWEHGVNAPTRTRVEADLRGEQPPEWAVDPDATPPTIDTVGTSTTDAGIAEHNAGVVDDDLDEAGFSNATVMGVTQFWTLIHTRWMDSDAVSRFEDWAADRDPYTRMGEDPFGELWAVRI